MMTPAEVMQTWLHGACAYEHAAVVKVLIESGANVNVENIDGDTPLHLACMNSHAAGGDAVD